MTAYRCFNCGNSATWDQVEFRNGETCHVGDCPPLPDGWEACDHCTRAIAPADQVPFYELWEVDWDIREIVGMVEDRELKNVWWPKLHPAHAPLPPGFVMREPGTRGLWGIPQGATGVAEWEPRVLDADGDLPEKPWPRVVCREHAAKWGWPPLGKGQAEAAAGPRKAGVTFEDRWAQVPHEEPGITVPEAMRLWGLSETKTRAILLAGETAKALLVTEVPNAGGGKPRKLYRRAIP